MGTGLETSSNAVDNYRTGDTYRYVSSYDNFDRNSHDHSESHSNLDSYTSINEASHSAEVGENKYKTMMSGMMTDMIKSTVSTAVDTVMESGSAKVAMIVSAIVFTQTSILNFVYYLDSVRRL